MQRNDNNRIFSNGLLPEGLRRMSEKYSRADKHGVATDLSNGVRLLVRAAWDGSMCQGVLTSKIPLATAIRNITAELDAAAMAFIASVPAEISAIVGAGNFDAAQLTQDVVLAFTNLKNLTFDGMRTLDYDNIQGALTKNEDKWRFGPLKPEVFVVQQFCLRMVQFAESFRQRTGARIDELVPVQAVPLSRTVSNNRSRPAAASVLSPSREKRMNYELSERIVGSPQWPMSIDDGNHNWAQLFGPRNGDDDDEHWLTPRMAAKIHHTAVCDGEGLLDDWGIGGSAPRLPKIARPFFRKSQSWRLALRDCYVRIAMRLQNGLPPSPNCTGEELVFHNIMYRVPDAYDEIEEELSALPEYQNDDDYTMVQEMAVQDEDVLMLYEANDPGYSDDEDINVDVDNSILGPESVASFMLGSGGGMTRTANLHPKDWFLAFKNNQFRNHL